MIKSKQDNHRRSEYPHAYQDDDDDDMDDYDYEEVPKSHHRWHWLDYQYKFINENETAYYILNYYINKY